VPAPTFARGSRLCDNRRQQFHADYFQDQSRGHSSTPSFAFVGYPWINSVAERFGGTLKKLIIRGRTDPKCAAPAAALDFAERGSRIRHIEKIRYCHPPQLAAATKPSP
jgi:transposase InsO family protein